MNVKFYTFNKRRNSTKQPTGSGTTVSCVLKAPTSIHDPVLELAGAPNVSYDYAYIGDFGRYYFVRDIVIETNGISTYYLTEDVLATHKTEIGNMRAYIAYASTGYDAMQIDSRIAVKTSRTMAGVASADILNNEGAYYLTVLNNRGGGGASGFSRSYQLNEAAISRMCEWFGDSTVMQSLRNYFNGNPMDAVFQCIWLPYKLYPTGGTATTVYIGNRNNVSDGYPLQSGQTLGVVDGWPQATKTINLTIPHIYSDFRKIEPYTTAFLYLPGIGNLDIKLSDFTTKINISVSIEILTGNITYLIFNDAGALVQSAIGNIASPCAMGKENTAGGKLISSIAQLAGGAVTLAAAAGTGGAAGAIGMAAGAGAALSGAANTILAANTHAPSVTGQMGGRGSVLWPAISLTLVAIDTEDPDAANYIAEKGRPVGDVQGIGGYSGYVQTIDAHIDCDGSAEEREEIESYLNSGIYYE